MRSLLWFLTSVMCVAPSAQAAPLTLPEAEQLALNSQPLLAAQEANVRAQREAAVAAQQLPDPRLKLALQNVPIDTFSLSEDFMTQRTVAIEQTFPGGNKRELRGRRGEQEAAQAVAELTARKRALRRDVAVAWLDLYYWTQSALLIAEQQSETQATIEALGISYAANKASLEEVLIARNALHSLRDRNLETVGQIARARAGLARWIGAAAEREVASTLPVFNVPGSAQLDVDLAKHPELAVYDGAIGAAESDVQLARAEKKPDWSLELAYSKRGSAYADMVSVQVGFDLPVFPANRQDRTSAAKYALLEKVRSERDDRLRILSTELAANYADYRAASARIDLLEKDTLPNTQQRIKAAQISYQISRSVMSNVYEAHHTELEARLQLLAQRVALAKSEARLKYFLDEGVP